MPVFAENLWVCLSNRKRRHFWKVYFQSNFSSKTHSTSSLNFSRRKQFFDNVAIFSIITYGPRCLSQAEIYYILFWNSIQWVILIKLYYIVNIWALSTWLLYHIVIANWTAVISLRFDFCYNVFLFFLGYLLIIVPISVLFSDNADTEPLLQLSLKHRIKFSPPASKSVFQVRTELDQNLLL